MSVPLFTRLPTTEIESVAVDRLPPEARQTIETIESGGAFPYRKDGSIFGNRERRLPIAKYGTYREYTVPTPGSRTRGARRIITAPQRIYYYTGDHYRSFQRVVR
jgi:ribonuclease T1